MNFLIEEDYSNHCPQAKVDADMALVKSVAGSNKSMVRFWTNQKALVVAASDTRLSGFDLAASALSKDGFRIVRRSSGGTAVVHVDGVLNMSWAFPVDTRKTVSMDQTYRVMLDPLQRFLASVGIRAEVGEVEGAYCNGSHDVSVSGKKIAGTAQRVCCVNQRRIALSHLTLNVNADVNASDSAINKFYLIAAGQERIQRNTSASISSILERKISSREFASDMTSFLMRNTVGGCAYTYRQEREASQAS